MPRLDAIDPRILPDMSAKVSFLSQEVTAEQQKPLLAVMPAALAVRDTATAVFVVRDGKLVKVPVRDPGWPWVTDNAPGRIAPSTATVATSDPKALDTATQSPVTSCLT